MERQVYINGEIVPDSAAKVSVHDKGFVYGDAVFDTMRTFGGAVFRAQEHIDRLYETLRYVRIDPGLDKPAMMAAVGRVIEANAPALRPGEDWWVTIRVTAGVIAMDGEMPGQTGATVVIECVPLPLRARASFFREGVPLAISHRPRVAPEALSPNAKTSNYMNMMLAQREVNAVAPGNWALMPDPNGNLAEGPGCNLFLVKDGKVLTPTTEYILAGVSRGEVISICDELGIPIIEQDISVHTAMTSDEAFLTSTSLCVCPVRSIDGADVPGQIPGPLTRRIMEAFAARAGFDFVSQYLAFEGAGAAQTGI
ncbi:MAG: aminotransferase class IV [Pseudomonadota bacterium]